PTDAPPKTVGDKLIADSGSNTLIGSSADTTFVVEDNATATVQTGSGGSLVDVSQSNNSAAMTITGAATVKTANNPPSLDAIGPQSVGEGMVLAFTAHAHDADLTAGKDTLAFSLEPVPGYAPAAGAGINAATGDFSWKPG